MCSVFHELVLGPPSQNLCNSPVRMQEAMADQLFWLCYIDIYVNTEDNVTNAQWVGSIEGTQTPSVSSQSHMTPKNMGHIWRVREVMSVEKKRFGVVEGYQVKNMLPVHWCVQKCSHVFDPSLRWKLGGSRCWLTLIGLLIKNTHMTSAHVSKSV